MRSEIREFEPSPNNWFESTVSYVGWGTATFTDPPGTVQGPTHVNYDESGHGSIEMHVERVSPESSARKPDPQWKLIDFFTRDESRSSEETSTLIIDEGWSRNPCSSVIVTTDQGRFSAEVDISYGIRVFGSESTEETIRLDFEVVLAEFRQIAHQDLRYWVLPLTNFRSSFRQQHPRLDHHPLRIFPTPMIPGDLSTKDRGYAAFVAASKNKLIIFESSTGLSFIEPLPDYGARQEELGSNKARVRTTAVLIGDFVPGLDDAENLRNSRFFDILVLLGFATGIQVGAPWLEFRDSEGLLAGRVHVALEAPVNSDGRGAFREIHSVNVATLLTQAHTSEMFGSSRLFISLRHLIRAGSHSLTLEDKLAHLFRALDGLCTEFGLNQRMHPKEIVGEDDAKRLKAVLRQARREIDGISHQNSQRSETEQKYFDRVIERVASAGLDTQGFGRQVVELLSRFEIHDAVAMQNYYERKPRHDKRSWPEWLSALRGTVMHNAYIDFQNGEASFADVWVTCNHLHDVLIRLTLKMMNYHGNYQPTMMAWAASVPVDWVQHDTPGERLGY